MPYRNSLTRVLSRERRSHYVPTWIIYNVKRSINTDAIVTATHEPMAEGDLLTVKESKTQAI